MTIPNNTKMLQAILNGQQSVREDLKNDIGKLAKKVDKNNELILENGKRIDRVGRAVAYLEDDTPTAEEFDELKKDYLKFKQKFAS